MVIRKFIKHVKVTAESYFDEDINSVIHNVYSQPSVLTLVVIKKKKT